jgi:large subunit ribosomal protein L21e
MKGSHGYRRRTRGLKVEGRDKGKVNIKKYMRDFSENDRVAINIDPTYQNIPHPRFQGRSGKVVGKQGRAYFIEIFDGSMEKKILVNPEHLNALR